MKKNAVLFPHKALKKARNDCVVKKHKSRNEKKNIGQVLNGSNTLFSESKKIYQFFGGASSLSLHSTLPVMLPWAFETELTFFYDMLVLVSMKLKLTKLPGKKLYLDKYLKTIICTVYTHILETKNCVNGKFTP